MIIVPGGFGSRKLVDDPGFIQWLRTATRCKFKVSIDLGLYLCEKLAGREAKERIRQQMDYEPTS